MQKLSLVSSIFIALSLNLSPVSAAADLDRISSALRQHIVTNYYPSPFQSSKVNNIKAQDLQQSIYFYVSENLDVKASSISKAWLNFLKKNFKTASQYESTLKAQNLSNKEVQEQYYQNIIFDKYFDEVLKPKLKIDFNKRISYLKYLNKYDLKINSKEYFDTLMNIENKYGGKGRFSAFLKANNVFAEDIEFYIRSELAKKVVAEDLFNFKYKNDPDFQAYIDALIRETYVKDYKREFGGYQNFYFRQYYVDKETDNANNIISKLYKTLYNNPKYRFNNSDFSGEIMRFDMILPENKLNNIYSSSIEGSVSKLKKVGEITPIITSNNGYHVLQLTKLETIEDTKFEEVKPKLAARVKDNYVSELVANDFDRLGSSLMQRLK